MEHHHLIIWSHYTVHRPELNTHIERWVKEKVKNWMKEVNCLTGFARAYPKIAYAVLMMSLQ